MEPKEAKEMIADIVAILADRIEAAWKRETVSRHSIKIPIVMPPCNAAAMRAAIKKAIAMILSNVIMGRTKFKPVIDVLEAALSSPPRNCDVGTAEEQIYLHREWCNRDNDSSYCCNDCRDCFARWAQMPYESEAAR